MLDILPSLASKAGEINTHEYILENLEVTWASKLDETGVEVSNILTHLNFRYFLWKNSENHSKYGLRQPRLTSESHSIKQDITDCL